MSLQAPRPRPRLWNVALGVVAAQVVGVLLAHLGKALSNPVNGPILGLTLFFVVPLAMGLASAYAWRREPLSSAGVLLLATVNLTIGAFLAISFLSEGSICLIIALPLVLAVHLAGIYLGRAVFARPEGRGPLRASIVPVLVAGVVLDSRLPQVHRAVVETRSAPIRATPAQLWPRIVAPGAIAAPPTYWLCRLGLPAPERVSAAGETVGARRDCVFTGNLVFGERITVSEPGKRLVFEIVAQPRDPEILGHADVERGEMELIDNGDGTTTIVGRSWYRLYVFPSAYFDLWAQAIGHAVHERVFEHLRTPRLPGGREAGATALPAPPPDRRRPG